VATGGTPLAGEVNSSFTTPVIITTTTYYVSLSIGACETARVPVLAEVNSIPPAPATSSGSSCGDTSVVLQATGGSNGQYRWYTSPTGGSSLPGEINDTFSTPLLTSTTNYFVSLSNGLCESSRTLAVATIIPLPAKPAITASGATTFCAGSTVTLSTPVASGYLWSTSETTQQITVSGSGIFTVSIEDANGCVSPASDPVSISVNALPAKPPVVASGATTFCEGGSVVLSAPAGFSYAWSDGITTQQRTIIASGNYSVSTTDSNGCTSLSSDPLAIIVNSAPAKPVITPSGSTTLCSGQSITLSAPAGFSYLWSTGASTQHIVVTATGNYTVQVTDANSCTSVSSDALAVTISVCNLPPAISSTTAQIGLEGNLTINLTALLSDPDNNLDLATLRIVNQPASGALASINSNFELVINYQGVSFTGDDTITIEVCDDESECVQQQISIEVKGDIVVMNGLSPNGDNINDHLQLKYIELLESTRQNRVTIYNRWGDAVFETVNYDNKNNIFLGLNKNGRELPSGTYLYKIEFATGRPQQTGYLVIKR
jgi:gliding motility-associated-like protein